MVMQIHLGSHRNHSSEVFRRFGANKGFDIPRRTDYVSNLRPLLDVAGHDPNFALIVFTLDETAYGRELVPLAGVYPALKLGPAWWFVDSADGMRRFRELTTETVGFYNTVGFSDDTRAFCSVPAWHDVARRVDCAFLASLITSALVAPEDPNAILQELTAEATRIVSLTITEKGYCHGGGDTALDFEHPAVKHDLQNPTPKSALGFLVRALEVRWSLGLRPCTVLSLDNLPENCKLTQQIVCEFAAQIELDLVRWIEKECKVPCTMVDRIVPATTEELIDRASGISGYSDPAVVAHEPFRQWVIEDDFVDSARPDFEAVGAELVHDVAPFEHMTLCMLNGTHSALVYIGSLAGH